jgi:hypothetical protein
MDEWIEMLRMQRTVSIKQALGHLPLSSGDILANTVLNARAHAIASHSWPRLNVRTQMGDRITRRKLAESVRQEEELREDSISRQAPM